MNELSKSKILIVDDSKINIEILVDTLKDSFKIGVATDGKLALRYVRENHPDLVLLDIMMPGINGYEVCKKIKADRKTKDIPVIFITAMGSTEEKTKGFEFGAVDYITKPFDIQEVLARVNTHLTIRNQKSQLKEYATQLEQMVEERTQQLIHAERLAALGTFAAAVVHEINNPNSAIMGYADLLQIFWEKAQPILEKHAHDESGQVSCNIKRVSNMIRGVLEGSKKIGRMTNHLMTYARKNDCNDKHEHSLNAILEDALNLLDPRLKKDNIEMETVISDECRINCDAQQIAQVFVNLMNNAADAMPESGGKINFQATSNNGQVVVRVKDNASGIPQDIADQIFDSFFTSKGPGKGTGLGLFIARSIIEDHEGTIELSSSGDQGTEFTLILPKHQ